MGCIPDTVKGKKVQPIHSLVKDDDNIQGEAREESEHSNSQSVQLVRLEFCSGGFDILFDVSYLLSCQVDLCMTSSHKIPYIWIP
ncbi:hypothetical protein BT93_L2106 [Corymbia citriodora subsp. variegata]|uniref:Uncharacterized protein n=1 Tax=Corymbia citriodora subsp. variegata TaxID=360336 RepID=A0A8T0CQG8_CORYI|nr:hypothetical protein BT93_L2106 [Corymbia citriodora subsp. variegata]